MESSAAGGPGDQVGAGEHQLPDDPGAGVIAAQDRSA